MKITVICVKNLKVLLDIEPNPVKVLSAKIVVRKGHVHRNYPNFKLEMYQKFQETAPTSMGADVPDSKRFKTEDCSQKNEHDIIDLIVIVQCPMLKK